MAIDVDAGSAERAWADAFGRAYAADSGNHYSVRHDAPLWLPDEDEEAPFAPSGPAALGLDPVAADDLSVSFAAAPAQQAAYLPTIGDVVSDAPGFSPWFDLGAV